jgi:hypothetical protein
MASWSETGDRYLLKLFRDFVFHQVGHGCYRIRSHQLCPSAFVARMIPLTTQTHIAWGFGCQWGDAEF